MHLHTHTCNTHIHTNTHTQNISQMSSLDYDVCFQMYRAGNRATIVDEKRENPSAISQFPSSHIP